MVNFSDRWCWYHGPQRDGQQYKYAVWQLKLFLFFRRHHIGFLLVYSLLTAHFPDMFETFVRKE